MQTFEMMMTNSLADNGRGGLLAAVADVLSYLEMLGESESYLYRERELMGCYALYVGRYEKRSRLLRRLSYILTMYSIELALYILIYSFCMLYYIARCRDQTTWLETKANRERERDSCSCRVIIS